MIRSDLRRSSTVIDACPTGSPTERDGNARPIDSRYNIGAQEGFRYVILMPIWVSHQ
jgi:hypothetical protein